MVMDPRKRQKKLERRQAKQKARRKELAVRGSRDLAIRLERASSAPILHCVTTDMLWDQGMSQLVVSRELAGGSVAFVNFLMDVYCLGVKDAMYDVVPRSVYEGKIYLEVLAAGQAVHLTPGASRKLVEGAVEFALANGLAPHRDYRTARLIFGDIDAETCDEKFVYGKHGKPLFIAGPYDTPARCSRIVAILAEHCGPDGFDYIMPFPVGAMLGGSREVRIDSGTEEAF